MHHHPKNIYLFHAYAYWEQEIELYENEIKKDLVLTFAISLI